MTYLRSFGYGLIIGGGVGFMAIRLANPELTETQLFLKFWLMAVLMVVGAVLIVAVNRKMSV